MNNRKTIALLLLFAFAATLITTVPVMAQTPTPAPTLKTYPVIDAIPNPVGVGQDVLIKTGILQQAGAVEQGWVGVTVTVVKPDNTTETLGPFRTDSTGSTFAIYTPDQVGTYKLTTNFPEQTIPVTFTSAEQGKTFYQGTIMKASTSETIDMVVQVDPLPYYPGHPLPTEYWTRPIDPQNREWYSIGGNWVERPANSLALFNDDAPDSAHVLWANPLTTGGLTGGLWGDGQIPAASEAGDAYEGKFPNSVILNGVLYYLRTDTRGEQAPAIIAVDLHTGEERLFRNNTSSTFFGQILYFNSYNYDGVFSYLWEATTVGFGASANTTWRAYDPFTGNQQIQIKNIPSGVRVRGPSGEILIYVINLANRWMALWNSTDSGLQNAVIGTPNYGSWGNTAHGTALGPGLDGANPRSYSWNVTLPAGLAYLTSFGSPTIKIYPDRIAALNYNQTMVRAWAIPLNSIIRTNNASVNTQTLSTLFDKTWAAPAEWLEGSNTLHFTGATNEAENGVIAVWDKELRKHYGFSTETGSFLWETDSEHYADAYGWGNVEHTWYFAYGKLYSTGVGGILYAYDLATGDTAWTYTLTDAYSEAVTGDHWWGWIDLIVDGKIYLGTLEHSAENPFPRGAPFISINATDGTEIWRVNGMFRQTRWGGNGIIGDSIIATMDTYDQRVWAIGKGPSAITVAAPDVSVDLGKSVVIKGTVTDVSPGTARYALTSRFPNGVPAVSDESQSEWMLYVYKQFPKPTNVTGVIVTLSVIDANGNFREIGTTTSDANGFYSLQWEPNIDGKYTVYASFGGSNAYYSSLATTAFAVDPLPDGTPVPTSAPQSAADMYFVPAVAGIIFAIAIVGVLLAILLLRKRPYKIQ